MAKRRLISLLPAWNQTSDLTDFFGATVDELFQPGTSVPLSGYIGRSIPNGNPNDFYVEEPNAARQSYQLESGMATFDSAGKLSNALTYNDLVNALASDGANVANHQRLFETDYYSWAPPINLDMLVNHLQYYWFGLVDGVDGGEVLPVLQLGVPMATYTGDGSTTTFALPASVAGTAETPTIYVDGQTLTTGVSVVGANIVCTTAPASGTTVLLARIPSLAALIKGAVSFDVSGFAQSMVYQGETYPIPPAATVSKLTSGMRIRIVDATEMVGGWDDQPWDDQPWDFAGDNTFMVDGVGASIRLTTDDTVIRALAAQYVTIDRSSAVANPWSARNSWVHEASYAWASPVFASAHLTFPDFSARRAARPIIEFVRDLVLYPNQTWTELAEPRFMLYDLNNKSLSDYDGSTFDTAVNPDGTVGGSRIFGYLHGAGVPDALLGFAPSYDLNGYYLFRNDAAAIQYSYASGAITSLYCYALTATGSTADATYHSLWHKLNSTTVQTIGDDGFYRVPLNLQANPLSADVETISSSTWIDHFPALIRNQSSFQGNAMGVNTYRDTARDLSLAQSTVTLTQADLTSVTALASSSSITFGSGDLASLGLKIGQTIQFSGMALNNTTFTIQSITTSSITVSPAPVDQSIPATSFTAVVTGEGSIFQHTAPLLKAMLLNASPSYNLPQAVRFVDQEYNRFRNKFARTLVDLLAKGTLSVPVQTALSYKGVWNASQNSPALTSGSGTLGDLYIVSVAGSRSLDSVSTWNVGDAVIFNGTAWSRIDVASAVTTTLQTMRRAKNNSMPFAMNRIGGGQYFIPPTPTMLGMLPSAVPSLVTDATYANPVLMILGHDGSRTPAFNDWRDPLMLGMETFIYSSLPEFMTLLGTYPTFTSSSQTSMSAQLAASGVSEMRPQFDMQTWIGNPFNSAVSNGYARSEISDMLAPIFERWAQVNHFDYRTNKAYDTGNAFTWNYNGVIDRFGNPLPGNWRAIYRWYYGTDAPHMRPWEMLGFLSEPSWWVGTYGAAPYTSTNTALWNDLEAGRIAAGPRAGTDVAFSRPGLVDALPVDASGNLLDPVQAGIVLTTVTFQVGSRNWQPGDHGPVENLWVTSPSYRYALATVAYLMKPARFVEECWDTVNLGYHGDQWVDKNTLNRPLTTTVAVQGATGTTAAVIGLSQWISDYLVSLSQNNAALARAVQGLDVRLIHQMAGFTSSDTLQAVSDTFGLLPSEDVQVTSYASPSLDSEVYSGVIIEWTGQGYRVLGYDARNPLFNIMPGDPNGPKGLISLNTTPQPKIVPWQRNTYYPVGVLVFLGGGSGAAGYGRYDQLNSVFQCTRSHTSGAVFEQDYWTPRSDLNPAAPQSPRVVTYEVGLGTVQQVPYGTVFYSNQDVADFLLGWQRWLTTRGWIFDSIDSQTGEQRDWYLSVKEFLAWTQVEWAPGNFVALSPGMQQLKFATQFGTILNVENSLTGFFGLVDRSGRPIGQRDAIINRLDGTIALEAKSADIFAARLNIAEIEHALVFSNVTVFNDNVYLPLFNLRQPRLMLMCNRASDWQGRADAPGFVIVGNQIRSDFQKATDDIRVAFDIELTDRVDLREYARHVIGFQERSYLNNLLINDIEQFEFYQGMISQKGAHGVFQKLMRSNRASNNSDLQFVEEWGVLLGYFGSPIDPFMTFTLAQSECRNDPQIVRFVPTSGSPPDWVVFTSPSDPHWVDRPNNPQFFTMQTTPTVRLPSAGPVRLGDVAYTAFSFDDLATVFQSSVNNDEAPFPTGSRTWVYERPSDRTYTVLRSFETAAIQPNSILQVLSNAEDASVTTTRLMFQQPLTLTQADLGNYLVIDGFSLSVPELQQVQLITAIDLTANSVDLAVVSSQGFDFTSDPSSAPLVRVLREVRFAAPANINNAPMTFAAGDLAWVDEGASGGWEVWAWMTGAWSTARIAPPRVDPTSISETVIYTLGATLTDTQMISDEPVVPEVTVIDPLAGIISGIADREIEFKSETDPALYNAGIYAAAGNDWGPEQIGRVWWDLSTVKFLEPYTDKIGMSQARDLTELAYRTSNWAQIAPNSSVDLYEWVESRVNPLSYTSQGMPGTVYNSVAPSWCERTSYDSVLGKQTTFYYFWVSGLTTTPDVSFRRTDIASAALAIANPSAAGLPWMAPINSDALIVSGVAQALNDTNTVMKVRLTLSADNSGTHDEWLLMRPGDETSQPSQALWSNLRDSLSGFDIKLNPVPNQQLPRARQTGVRPGQAMFTATDRNGTRAPLMAARQAFVQSVNTILATVPLSVDRSNLVGNLNRSDAPSLYLQWSQFDQSYTFVPPPDNEWDVQVFSFDQRDRLLMRADFQAAINNGTSIRVLINGVGNALQQWSIWLFSGSVASALLASNASLLPAQQLSPDQVLLTHVDAIFTLATAYNPQYAVPDLTHRNALVQTIINAIAVDPRADTRVLVNDGVNFWAIYKYLPSDPYADANGFVLWRTQLYRTSDFYAASDWYASGYSASNPPVVVYDSAAQRDQIEGSTPINQLVKVLSSDLSHPWTWTAFVVSPDSISSSGWWVWTGTYWASASDPHSYLAMGSPISGESANGTSAMSTGGSIVDADLVTWTLVESSSGLRVARNGVVDTTTQGVVLLLYWNHKVYQQNSTGGQWTTVAIANGTMQLSSQFYSNVSAPVHGFNQLGKWDMGPWDSARWANLRQVPETTDVASRDGSWELRVLADVLRWSPLLLETEINQLFFNMLHFVHVQQNDVDWAFKTSFMNVIGYGVPLPATPYQTADQTANLLDYINEVKPYHCKIRETMTQYNAPLDIANIDSAQIEHSYLFDITILFDRISGDTTLANWDMAPWSSQGWGAGENSYGSAAYRILTMTPNADLTGLLSLDFKAGVIDGYILQAFGSAISDFGIEGFDTEPFDSAVSEVYPNEYDGSSLTPSTPNVEINPPQPSRPGGLDLRDPYYAADHPEERVPFGADDGLHMTVTAGPLAGGPPQIIKTFQVQDYTGSSATLFFDLIAQSIDAVLVYRDGVRVTLGSDYAIDHFAQTATVNLPTGTKTVTIHAFGFGGASTVVDAEYLSYQSNPVTLNESVNPSTLLVTVDGSILQSGDFSASGNSLTLSSPPSVGSDVAVVSFAGGPSTAALIQQQTLSYNANRQWTLDPFDGFTVPPHAGTIVEVNGKRIAPAPTYYGAFTPATPFMYLPQLPQSGDSVTIYANGFEYTSAVPTCTQTSDGSTYPFHLVVPNGETPPTYVAGQFVYFDNLLVALDPSFVGTVAMVIQPNGTQADYSVSGQTLTINESLSSSDNIVVTTFSNASSMGVETVVYPVSGHDYVIPLPVAKDYVMVWMNGLRLAPDVDYEVGFDYGGWDMEAWDAAPWDISYTTGLIHIFTPTSGNVVVTVFTAEPSREEMQWMINTITPAFQRMRPVMVDGKQLEGYPTNSKNPSKPQYGWGTDSWDSIHWDERAGENGPWPLYRANFSYSGLGEMAAGTLVAPLGATDTSLSLNLFLRTVSPKLQPEQPFTIPTDSKPGVIWIDGERIEYWSYVRSGNTATLSNLRRQTTGTVISEQRRVQTATSNGTPIGFTFANLTGTVQVMAGGAPLASNAFSTSVSGGTTTVTVNAPANAFVAVSLDAGNTYPAGTVVYNGDNRLRQAVPIGFASGNREMLPMHQIIAG